MTHFPIEPSTRAYIHARANAPSMADASRCVMCVTGGAAVMAEARCLWCQGPFEPRRGGSRQRFCRPLHRIQFHTAARIWAERAMVRGILTISELRNGHAEPCTLLPYRKSRVPLSDIGSADPALMTALRRLGQVVVRVSIAPEGIAELVRLGWLERRQCRQSAVVADAVIELAEAALDARLRPR